jgi:uncharacterized protein (DUF2235 family)
MGTDDQNADSQTPSMNVDPSKNFVCQMPTKGPARARQIIICCDGTNNTLTGGTRDTNVLKLISHLVPGDEDQILYYDPGVGSPDQLPSMGMVNYLNRKRERISGLAMGRGIYENIAEAYLFLVEKYREGDEIYIFGFSRGAFTARCVAGMVNLFGLIRSDSKPLILTLIRVYFSTPSEKMTGYEPLWAQIQATDAERDRKEDKKKFEEIRVKATQRKMTARDIHDLIKGERRLSTREEVAEQVRKEFTTPHGANAVIHFIGVWDTVASVGLPLISRRSITSDGKTRGKNFRHIRHALSMDEHRFTFEPRLYWDADYECYVDHKDENGKDVLVDGKSPDKYKNKTLQQKWFRGVHSDVGGGYSEGEAGLATRPYLWMMAEAEKCGLRTDPNKKKPEEFALPFIAHDQPATMPYWSIAGLSVRHNKIPKKEDESTADGSKKTLWNWLRKIAKAEPSARVPIREDGIVQTPTIHLFPYFKGKRKKLTLISALAMLMLVFVGRMAYLSLFEAPAASYWSSVGQGMLCLDFWQRTLIPVGCQIEAGNALLRIVRPDYAYGALLLDFFYVLLYAWVVGLLTGWAFREVTLNRMPVQRLSPLLWLGWAPCVLVFGHLAEIVLTAMKIWLVQNNIIGIPDFAPLLLSPTMLEYWIVGADKAIPGFTLPQIAEGFLIVAHFAKWVGFAGSLVLIVWGVVQRAKRPAPAPDPHENELTPDARPVSAGIEAELPARPGIRPDGNQPAIGKFRAKGP